jgi:DHA1 family bicyclomycin/chloramphenicol resistance-like MFS transporter
MKKQIIIVFILMLMISIGSIGAVIITPALPQISLYYKITNNIVNYTISFYLIGYALGQLIYGPLMNMYGSKKTILIGTIFAIIGLIISINGYYTYRFALLLFGRFIAGLGLAYGIKMTYTLTYSLFPKTNNQIIGIITLAFAITPSLSVFLSSIIISYYNSSMILVLMIIYSILLLILSFKLPNIYINKNINQTFKISSILNNYKLQFNNNSVIYCGILMGIGTSILYIFASISPFIAINKLHINIKTYGLYNLIPNFGIVIGSLLSSYYSKVYHPQKLLKLGLIISTIGSIVLLFLNIYFINNIYLLFYPMIIIYCGLSFIFGNSISVALYNNHDISNASSVVSFINLGFAILINITISFCIINQILILSFIFLCLLLIGILCYNLLINNFKDK